MSSNNSLGIGGTILLAANSAASAAAAEAANRTANELAAIRQAAIDENATQELIANTRRWLKEQQHTDMHPIVRAVYADSFIDRLRAAGTGHLHSISEKEVCLETIDQLEAIRSRVTTEEISDARWFLEKDASTECMRARNRLAWLLAQKKDGKIKEWEYKTSDQIIGRSLAISFIGACIASYFSYNSFHVIRSIFYAILIFLTAIPVWGIIIALWDVTQEKPGTAAASAEDFSILEALIATGVTIDLSIKNTKDTHTPQDILSAAKTYKNQTERFNAISQKLYNTNTLPIVDVTHILTTIKLKSRHAK